MRHIPVIGVVLLMIIAGGAVAVTAAPAGTAQDQQTKAQPAEVAVENKNKTPTTETGLGPAVANGVGPALDAKTSMAATSVHGAEEVWTARSSNPDQYDIFIDTAQLSDGSTIAVGYLFTDQEQVNAIVMKISNDGEVLWERQLGGDLNDGFWGVVPTDDGGALVVGDTNSPSLTGGDRSYDGYVVRFSSSGAVQWERTFGTADDDFIGGVAQTSSGFVLAGERNNLDGKVSGWTLEIDENGNLLDSKYHSPNEFTSYRSIDQTGSGSYIATGITASDSSNVLGLLSRFDSDITRQWDRTIRTDDDADLVITFDSTTAPDGSFVTAGYVYDDSRGTYEMIYTRTSADGEPMWTAVTETETDHFGLDVVTIDDQVLLTDFSVEDQPTTTAYAVQPDGDRREVFNVTNALGLRLAGTDDGNLVMAGETVDDTGQYAWIGEYSFQSGGSNDSRNESVPDANHLIKLEPRHADLSSGGTTTIDVVFTNATNGVGAFNYINITLNSTSAVEITDISTDVSAADETVVADDGSKAAVRVNFAGDTEDTGNVTIATITVKATGQGTAAANVELTRDISDEDGKLYSDVATVGGTISVGGGPPAVPGFENAPTDPDGDGKFEDINGNGDLDIGDVQALFANRNSDVVQNNVDAFDFNNNGKMDIGDVQALFNEITG